MHTIGVLSEAITEPSVAAPRTSSNRPLSDRFEVLYGIDVAQHVPSRRDESLGGQVSQKGTGAEMAAARFKAGKPTGGKAGRRAPNVTNDARRGAKRRRALDHGAQVGRINPRDVAEDDEQTIRAGSARCGRAEGK